MSQDQLPETDSADDKESIPISPALVRIIWKRMREMQINQKDLAQLTKELFQKKGYGGKAPATSTINRLLNRGISKSGAYRYIAEALDLPIINGNLVDDWLDAFVRLYNATPNLARKILLTIRDIASWLEYAKTQHGVLDYLIPPNHTATEPQRKKYGRVTPGKKKKSK